jgi:guanine deaminase
MNPDFMKMAVAEARWGLRRGEGGPFGAVVVIGGEAVARGHNRVIVSHDPTAHAEIVALRKASRHLGRFDLSDAELYTTCEPCPMCLGAIHWARIKRMYFGCTSADAARAGFDDKAFFDSLRRVGRIRVKAVPLLRPECLPLFREWSARPGRVRY